MLKGVVSFVLVIIWLIEFRSQNLSAEQAGLEPVCRTGRVRSQLLSTGFKKISVILALFIGYLTLTLTYSSNPAYGFQKILNFIISVVPSVLVFYYLISTITELRIKLFIYSLGIISVITVSYILIDYPFDQGTIYNYKPGRWSHVIYGRMISSFAVILLLYLVWMVEKSKTRLLPKKLTSIGQVRDTSRQAKDERRKVLFLIFISSIAIYGTYLSALRAAFVGLMLVGGGLLIHSLWFVSLPAGRQVCRAWIEKQKSQNIITKNKALSTKERIIDYRQVRPVAQVLSTLLMIIILTALLIFLVPKPDIINIRFDNMIAIDDLQFKGDPAIHSRLDEWELSWEMIKEHPFLGAGLGGFNGYNNIEWTRVFKYSHNIVLEMTAEGGLVGLLVLCSLFVVIFKNFFNSERTDNTSHVSRLTSRIFLLTFFLFALWLALFSKEFSNQTVLWIGLVFVGLKRDDC